MGRQLLPVVTVLRQWGGECLFEPSEPRQCLVGRRTEAPVAPVQVHSADGEPLAPNDTRIVMREPGGASKWRSGPRSDLALSVQSGSSWGRRCRRLLLAPRRHKVPGYYVRRPRPRARPLPAIRHALKGAEGERRRVDGGGGMVVTRHDRPQRRSGGCRARGRRGAGSRAGGPVMAAGGGTEKDWEHLINFHRAHSLRSRTWCTTCSKCRTSRRPRVSTTKRR